MIDIRRWHPLEIVAGVLAGGVAIASQFADPEVISAIAAVVWRAEGLFDLPEWVSWLVFVVLIIAMLATIRKAVDGGRS